MREITARAGEGTPNDVEVYRQIFQGKWRLPILREIAGGPRRLSNLRRSVPHASKKMLVDTLHGLERMGWIVRTEYEEATRRVEYSLSEEHSEKILGILNSIPHP
jgi:DNA-binding HxlR family transcriptional regulator